MFFHISTNSGFMSAFYHLTHCALSAHSSCAASLLSFANISSHIHLFYLIVLQFYSLRPSFVAKQWTYSADSSCRTSTCHWRAIHHHETVKLHIVSYTLKKHLRLWLFYPPTHPQRWWWLPPNSEEILISFDSRGSRGSKAETEM